MGISYSGRASINPAAPEALGICGRCGFMFKLRDLRYQDKWSGAVLITTSLRVCDRCYDIPQQQFRSIRLPPDPWPVDDPRPENFAAALKNFLTLKKIIGKPAMFDGGQSQMAAVLTRVLGFGDVGLTGQSDLAGSLSRSANLMPAFSDVSDVTADITQISPFVPAFSDVSNMTVDITQDHVMPSAFSDVSNMTADITQVTPPTVSRTFTDSFTFNDTGSHNEAGVSIGTADSTRIVVIAVSGFSQDGATDRPTACTIHGESATLADEAVSNFSFAQIWYASVPTGTSGAINLTFTGVELEVGVGVYAVYEANSLLDIDNNSSTGTTVENNMGIPANTVTISAAGMAVNFSDPTVTWSNNTEDYEAFVSSAVSVSSASRQDSSAVGALTIGATVSGKFIGDTTMASVTLGIT